MKKKDAWTMIFSVLLMFAAIGWLRESHIKLEKIEKIRELIIQVKQLKEENELLKSEFNHDNVKVEKVMMDGHEYIVVMKNGEPSTLKHNLTNCSKCLSTDKENKK